MKVLEKLLKRLMLWVGILGLLVIYGGFFLLLLSGRSTAPVSWYFLLSPWICIFFGLTSNQQRQVLNWFKHKITK
jgi:hypothetical protein